MSQFKGKSTEELMREQKLLKRMIAVDEAKNDFLRFVQFTMPDPDDIDDSDLSMYTITPLSRVLGEILMKVERGELLRVALSVGPQYGKSEMITRRFPPWFSGRNPHRHVILGTYNQDRASEEGGEVREIIEGTPFKQVFPKYRLRTGSQSKELMITDRGGKMAFVGVGGSGSGKPADLILIDDPIKNDEEAQSETYRERQWNWFNRVAYARAKTTTAIVVVHCLVGATLVTMADGSAKPIADIRPSDEVFAHENHRFVPRRVLNWASQGEDDILELKTGNHTVRGNARHPFLTVRGGKTIWVPLGELVPGDSIVCSAIQPGEGERLDETEAWLLGFMFGDGWVTVRNAMKYDKKWNRTYPRRGFVTCCAFKKYFELNEKVLQHFEAVFGFRPKATEFGYWRTEKQDVGRWFSERGMIGKAKTKRLPAWLFSESVAVRQAFMQGFTEADGHVDKKSQTTVASANPNLLADLRHLARSAGVKPSNIHRYAFTAQPPNSPRPVDGVTYSFKWGVNGYDTAFDVVNVRSVEKVGRAEVFDIQVEGAENFIADGLVCHNTRWSEDDLIGRLCDPDHPERNKKYAGIADDWTYINLPAVVSDPALAKALGLTLEPQTDPRVIAQFGAKPMTTLWPERKSLLHLASARRLDARGFDALYMGKPSPDDGDYFKADWLVEHFKPEEYPKNLRKYAASDHALSEKEKADSTCMGAFGIDEHDDIWIMPDLVWRKMEADTTLDEMLGVMKQHRPVVWFAEDEHINKTLGPFRRKRMAEEKIYTLVKGMTSTKDLRARARSIQGRMAMRKVHFPAWMPWWSMAKSELLKFPFATHDDFVSFMSLIGRGLDAEYGAEQVKVEKNVIRVGSIEWMKRSAANRNRAAQLKKGRAGF